MFATFEPCVYSRVLVMDSESGCQGVASTRSREWWESKTPVQEWVASREDGAIYSMSKRNHSYNKIGEEY